jgi:hypothetical protein
MTFRHLKVTNSHSFLDSLCQCLLLTGEEFRCEDSPCNRELVLTVLYRVEVCPQLIDLRGKCILPDLLE